MVKDFFQPADPSILNETPKILGLSDAASDIFDWSYDIYS
jgi:hypothetical protein